MPPMRSEEHTSELQSHSDLVCRLLLEKKKAAAADIVASNMGCPIRHLTGAQSGSVLWRGVHHALPSFPTRRSSDLDAAPPRPAGGAAGGTSVDGADRQGCPHHPHPRGNRCPR